MAIHTRSPLAKRRRWPIVLAVIGLVAIAGVVIGTSVTSGNRTAPTPGDRAEFLRLVGDRGANSSARLTAAVADDPDAVVAAGMRACAWAAAHPQFPYDNRLRNRYDQRADPPDFGANTEDGDISGFIAEVAWDHLCHLHFVGGDD